MTKEQKKEACIMRQEGKTYQEIGTSFGVSRQYIEQIVKKKPATYSEKKVLTSEKCIYKGLAEYIEQEKCTLLDLKEIINPSLETTMPIRERLSGTRQFKMKEISRVLEYTGMTFEECFKEK